MKRSAIRVILIHGQLPPRPRPRRHIVFHRHVKRPPGRFTCNPYRRAAIDVPCCPTTKTVSLRCHCRSPRSSAYDLDLARWRCRLLLALASNQGQIYARVKQSQWGDEAQRTRRIRHMAGAVLGTHNTRRQRFRTARKLHSLQPGKTFSRYVPNRLALVIGPSIHPTGLDSRDLGGRSGRRRLRRMIPGFRCASSGLRNCVSIHHWAPPPEVSTLAYSTRLAHCDAV